MGKRSRSESRTARDETAAVLAFAVRGQNGPAEAITVALQLHLLQLRTRGSVVGGLWLLK